MIQAEFRPEVGARPGALDALRTDIEARLRAEGLRVESHVRYGHPAEEIIEHIRHWRYDLVAMTTHGRSGVSRLLMGSVTESVIRGATIPVLVVRAAGVQVPEAVPQVMASAETVPVAAPPPLVPTAEELAAQQRRDEERARHAAEREALAAKVPERVDEPEVATEDAALDAALEHATV